MRILLLSSAALAVAFASVNSDSSNDYDEKELESLPSDDFDIFPIPEYREPIEEPNEAEKPLEIVPMANVEQDVKEKRQIVPKKEAKHLNTDEIIFLITTHFDAYFEKLKAAERTSALAIEYKPEPKVGVLSESNIEAVKAAVPVPAPVEVVEKVAVPAPVEVVGKVAVPSKIVETSEETSENDEVKETETMTAACVEQRETKNIEENPESPNVENSEAQMEKCDVKAADEEEFNQRRPKSRKNKKHAPVPAEPVIEKLAAVPEPAAEKMEDAFVNVPAAAAQEENPPVTACAFPIPLAAPTPKEDKKGNEERKMEEPKTCNHDVKEKVSIPEQKTCAHDVKEKVSIPSSQDQAVQKIPSAATSPTPDSSVMSMQVKARVTVTSTPASAYNSRRNVLIERIYKFVREESNHPLNTLLLKTAALLSQLDERRVDEVWGELGNMRQAAIRRDLRRFMETMTTLNLQVYGQFDDRVPTMHYSPVNREPLHIIKDGSFDRIAKICRDISGRGMLRKMDFLSFLEVLMDLIEREKLFDAVEIDIFSPMYVLLESWEETFCGYPEGAKRGMPLDEIYQIAIEDLKVALANAMALLTDNNRNLEGHLQVARFGGARTSFSILPSRNVPQRRGRTLGLATRQTHLARGGIIDCKQVANFVLALSLVLFIMSVLRQACSC